MGGWGLRHVTAAERECERDGEAALAASLPLAALPRIFPCVALPVVGMHALHSGSDVPVSAYRWRTPLACAALGLLSACASRSSAVGTPLNGPQPVTVYSCGVVLSLRVRLDATSASITAEGDGPYTLPQVSGRAGFTVYSDGTRVLQIYGGDVSFGLTPRVLFPCVRSD